MKHTIKGFIAWDEVRHDNREYFGGHGFCFTEVAPKPYHTGIKLLCEHTIEFEVPEDFNPHEPNIEAIEEEVCKARDHLLALELKLAGLKGKT